MKLNKKNKIKTVPVFQTGTILGVALLLLSAISCQTTSLEPETETPSSETTKFARFVPPSTATPSRTPPATQTPSPTRTPTLTRTTAPTRTNPPPTRPVSTATVTLEPISVGEKYGTLSVVQVNEPLAELNLTARGFVTTTAILGLVDYPGAFDEGAPQLYRLFSDERLPTWVAAYQVHSWDTGCNCRTALLADPPVTLVSVTTKPGEVLRLPRSSYYIANDYQALVIYADAERITLNYTREANSIRGYTLYLEGIAVDTGLLSSYAALNAAGRALLPAIQPGQGLGKARGTVVTLAIRDAGAFMDPRSRKDWWRGK